MQHAPSLAVKSQDPNTRWTTAITAARIETAETNPAHSAAASATRKELTTIVTKSRELGYAGIELDARLATEQLRPGKAVLDEMESVQNGTIVRLWSNNCAFVSFQ
jgi:hypothetical protein